MNSEIDKARVPDDNHQDHPTLFPLSDFSHPRHSPQAVCKEMGLNWLMAIKLHEDGWLSFNPKEVERLNAWQYAELTFVGSLVVAGCDYSVLENVLGKLQKPYSYHVDRIYYDWQGKTWRLLEDVDDLEDKFDEWIEELVACQDVHILEMLRDSVEKALLYLRGRRGLPLNGRIRR